MNHTGMAVMLRRGQEPVAGEKLNAADTAEMLAHVDRLPPDAMALVDEH
jgi:hypothetical protein